MNRPLLRGSLGRRRDQSAAALTGVAVVVLATGCPKPDAGAKPVATSKPTPVTQPGTAPPPRPPPAVTAPADPHKRVEVRVTTLSDPQDGWLRIDALRPDAPGAWATGYFLKDQNKIVILRIDGHSSELIRKRRPILHLRRSPAGSWDVVEPQ